MARRDKSPVLRTLDEVLKRVPYGKPWLYRLVGRGEFPAPVRVGANRVAWVESEVDKWLADKVAERNSLENEIARRDAKARAALRGQKAVAARGRVKRNTVAAALDALERQASK
jgi:prophage regulatory protein